MGDNGASWERLIKLALGLYIAKEIFEGAQFLKRNVVEPVKKFVGPSLVPPGPAQAKLVGVLDQLMKDFPASNTDDVVGARNAIANDAATIEQKLTACLHLNSKIEQVESYGAAVPVDARARIAEVKAALGQYMKTELQPEAARIRLR